jgi:hypothetical protein
LAAHGERDMTRMFIQPVVGQTSRPRKEAEAGPQASEPPYRESDSWSDGPQEL